MTQARLKRNLLNRGALAVALSLAGPACASDETVAAEQALAKWRNKRPQQYTYVLQPMGFGNHGDAVRIKVESLQCSRWHRLRSHRMVRLERLQALRSDNVGLAHRNEHAARHVAPRSHTGARITRSLDIVHPPETRAKTIRCT